MHMTLSKQLLILISVLFLTIFSVNYVSSVNNIRSYLQVESEVHAQDTATSLGLSLSPYIANETDPVMEAMMNAIFDMGYYKEIKLVNVDDKPLITLVNDKIFEEVPDWFVELLPMKAASAKSEISSGWSIGGVIYVTINPGYAYLKLYEQAKSAFYYSLAAFLVSMVLLFVVLRFMLLPLKKINQQALAIAEGNFEISEPLPWTTEVRNVARSMNVMSTKIGGIKNKLNARLEALGKTLQLDDLTGLNKKSSFETDMKQLFMEQSEAYVYLIKFDSLTGMTKEQSSDSIDQFLQDCAKTLKQSVADFATDHVGAYHFFGSEFALLARDIDAQQAEQLSTMLTVSLTELGEKYQKADIAHIGVAPFDPFGTTAGILAAANEAFEQAKLIGANSYFIRDRGDQAKDIAEWKALVFNVVDQSEYTIAFIGTIASLQSGQVMMQEAFIKAHDRNGELIPIGTFVSIAEKFEKIVELDKSVTEKVIEHIESQHIDYAIAVNLSTRTVKNSDFRAWLATSLQKHQAISAQLVFSISAYAAAKEVKVFKEFIKFIHGYGAKVILKRFDSQSMSLETAKILKPDYIRLARDMGNGVSHEPSKQAFVETMKEVGDLLDITVLAENVQADEDFALIKTIGITGASR
jgi:EAL domain-containing protein (putative c-di-GMP-specific phosphodiesterase class I)/GGDEF domain-containing protein